MAIINNTSNELERFQDVNKREEAESVLPKVKSWRDAGETPCKKNQQEEAKLLHLHTTSPHTASPLHVKWRNQEGSCATRHQRLTCLGEADQQVSK
jgi:hypothetical protein